MRGNITLEFMVGYGGERLYGEGHAKGEARDWLEPGTLSTGRREKEKMEGKIKKKEKGKGGVCKSVTGGEKEGAWIEYLPHL